MGAGPSPRGDPRSGSGTSALASAGCWPGRDQGRPAGLPTGMSNKSCLKQRFFRNEPGRNFDPGDVPPLNYPLSRRSVSTYARDLDVRPPIAGPQASKNPNLWRTETQLDANGKHRSS